MKRAAITTRLDTAESVIWKEWQEMAAEKHEQLKGTSPATVPQEQEPLPQASPRRQKPKTVRRHPRSLVGARRS